MSRHFRRHRSTRRARSESLETRRLFLTHTVDGTSAADAISIGISGNQILIVVNGVSDTKLDSLYDEVIINCNGGSDTVSVIATGDNQITVNGGAGNDTLNAGNGSGSLVPIADPVTFLGGADTDTLILHDQNRAATAVYTVAGSSVTTTGANSFTFSTVENVDIRATSLNSILVVDDAPSASVKFDGGTHASGGSDSVSYESTSPTAFNLRPSATTTGAHSATWGTRTIDVVNTERCTLDGVDLTVTTQSANDVVSVQGGNLDITSGGVLSQDVDVFTLAGLTLDLAANDAGAGNDTVSIGVFDFVSAPVLKVNAGTGNNAIGVFSAVTLDTDLGASRGNNVAVSVNSGAHLTFDGAQSLKELRIQNNSFVDFIGSGSLLTARKLEVGGGTTNVLDLASGQSGTITEDFTISTTGGTLVFDQPGTLSFLATVQHSHVANASVLINRGTIRFNSDAGSNPAARNLSVVVQLSGKFLVGSTQHLRQLGVQGTGGASAVVDLGGDIVVVAATLTVADTSVFLDLNDNALIVDYSATSPVSTLISRITTGRNGGTWNGPGIRSGAATLNPGTALGLAEAIDLFGAVPSGTTWLGEPIDSTSVLVRHTLEGDATLDRSVNFDDLLKLAANYNGTSTRWSKGDFTFDDATNFDDLLKLASKYNQSLPAAPQLVDDDESAESSDAGRGSPLA